MSRRTLVVVVAAVSLCVLSSAGLVASAQSPSLDGTDWIIDARAKWKVGGVGSWSDSGRYALALNAGGTCVLSSDGGGIDCTWSARRRNVTLTFSPADIHDGVYSELSSRAIDEGLDPTGLSVSITSTKTVGVWNAKKGTMKLELSVKGRASRPSEGLDNRPYSLKTSGSGTED
jgi:hypothetical protein